MVSPLAGPIRKAIAAGFKGKLSKGTLRRETPGGLDTFGDATALTVKTWKFEGIQQDFSAFYKQNAGIPETDVSILFIGGSLPAGVIPQKDDLAFINPTPYSAGTWYRIRKQLQSDPANASYLVQAFVVPAP